MPREVVEEGISVCDPLFDNTTKAPVTTRASSPLAGLLLRDVLDAITDDEGRSLSLMLMVQDGGESRMSLKGACEGGECRHC